MTGPTLFTCHDFLPSITSHGFGKGRWCTHILTPEGIAFWISGNN